MSLTNDEFRYPVPRRPFLDSGGFNAAPVDLLQDILTASATKHYDLGERLQVHDRVFHYMKNGTPVLTNGELLVGPSNGGTTTLQTDLAMTGAEVIAATDIDIETITDDFTANQFADGWFMVQDDGTTTDQQGMIMRIKSHNLVDSASDVTMTVYFHEGIPSAIDSDAKVMIIGHEYNGVIVSPTTPLSQVVGVALITVPTLNYFWGQTWGPCACLCGSAGIAGNKALRSLDTEGAIDIDVAGTNLLGEVVGAFMHASSDTDAAFLDLRLKP